MTRRARHPSRDGLRDVELERRIIRDLLLHGMGTRYADTTLTEASWAHPVHALVWQVASALDADGTSVTPVTVSARAQHPDLSLPALTRLAAGYDPRMDVSGLTLAATRLNTLAAARRVVARLDDARRQVLAHPEVSDEALAYLAAHQAHTRAPAGLVPLIDLLDVTTEGALVEGVFLPDSLAALWGPSNAGKTALLHDLAIAQATGGVWCGRRCRAVPVAILAYEGRWGLRRRLEAAAAARGVRDLRDLAVYVFDRPPSLGDEAGLRAVRRALDQHGIGAVYVDTLAAACAGALDIDSGAGGDAARAVAALRSLQPDGGLVLAAHHCGHDVSRMRGAYAFLAALDTELHAADGVLSSRKQRDLPSDLRVSYALIPQGDTIVVGYAGHLASPRDDLRERVAAALRTHPGASKSAIQQIVRGKRERVFQLVDELRASIGSRGSGTVPASLEPAGPERFPGSPPLKGGTGNRPPGTAAPGTYGVAHA